MKDRIISDSFWRHLTNLWTTFFVIVVVSDFVTGGRFSYLITPFSIIYGSMLSIFVGTKEFSRWHKVYRSKKHPGEMFVIIWSVLLITMLLCSWIFGNGYKISSDIISVYIMVLTVFAITQSSKTLYKTKRGA